jgi:beta-N-acetylhexosaminidase
MLVSAAVLALMAGLVTGSWSGDEPRSSTRAAKAPTPQERQLRAVDRLTLRQQVGQMTMSCFPAGPVPDWVRRRLRAGETAGVILFGYNAGSRREWRSITRALQGSARGGALVAVDQEGGEIRTVSWAGPAAGQPAQGDPSAVRSASQAAARQLRGSGVNVNLAPVADVPSGASVMRSRAFAGGTSGIAARTRAAIRGMREGRVAATAKHFPGFGAASVNTDDGSATITSSEATIDSRELVPFRAAVRERVPLVMLAHALYPALDPARIASQSPVVVRGLLRRELGFEGVVVTDSLEAQAVVNRSGVATAAERSIEAGADLILMTGSASWNQVYPRLLARARRSPAFRARVEASAARVLALKKSLGLELPQR